MIKNKNSIYKDSNVINSIFIAGAVTGNENKIENYDLYLDVIKNVLGSVEIITPNNIMKFRNDYNKNNKNATEREINAQMVAFDLEKVKNANLIVADVSEKSTGVGIELGTALNQKTKILLFAKMGAVVSNMIFGAFPNVSLIRYIDLKDFKQLLNMKLLEILQ